MAIVTSDDRRNRGTDHHFSIDRNKKQVRLHAEVCRKGKFGGILRRLLGKACRYSSLMPSKWLARYATIEGNYHLQRGWSVPEAIHFVLSHLARNYSRDRRGAKNLPKPSAVVMARNTQIRAAG
jgi:hypothetical protein